MKKRALSLALAACMICLLTMTACSTADAPINRGTGAGNLALASAAQEISGFSDVPADADYAEAVAWCRENRILNGIGDGRFDPEGSLTRAMLVAALYRAEGEPAVSGTPAFADAQAGTWYSNAVTWAGNEGLVQGYGDGRFGTDDPVSVEQMEVILGRYLGDGPEWVSDPSKAVAATRAQVAVALYHAMKDGREPPSVAVFDLASGTNGSAPTVTLSSGYEMPVAGIGTYSLKGEECVNAIKSALEQGVRLIDTAYMYGNEKEVGRAVREFMAETGTPREDIFLITKIYPGEQFSDPEKAIQDALDKLDVGYIDMMLLHHPGANDVSAYKAMEQAVADGKIRSLGLSNWYIEEIDDFVAQVDIKPALVQNEIHPYYQEQEVIPYMHDLGIVMQAWYPLGGRGRQKELLSDGTLTEIARAHGVSVAQVILRWDLQNGVVVIPGSSNPDHIRENISLFDFELTEEEMAAIAALDRGEKHDWY